MQMCIVVISCIRPAAHELGFSYCGQIAWKTILCFGMLVVSRGLALSLLKPLAIIVRPPHLGFGAFADKSLGRNGIKLAC